jgi:hypothetical protein
MWAGSRITLHDDLRLGEELQRHFDHRFQQI